MTRARQTQVSLGETPFYHCLARCVRRAFLCGEDAFSGKSYEHRRQWIVDRLKELTSVFAIDISAFSVLSNHTHTILHVDKDRAEAWSEVEVVERWTSLYKGNLLVSRYMAGETTTSAEREVAVKDIETWRGRLYDISWFMRGLNEFIARKANEEDGCTGRFWEGRFKSQALLDDAAILTCMQYVDLNPIRAGIAETPEGSDYTSIQERLHAFTATTSKTTTEDIQDEEIPTPIGLMPFTGTEHMEKELHIPISFIDYMQLVDWTGRAVRDDKAGAIPSNLAPILERIGVEPAAWVGTIKNYGSSYYRAVGAVDKIKKYSDTLGQSWMQGIKAVQSMYKTVPI